MTTYDLQLRKVITPSPELHLDSMESPLSQEFIHMPEEIAGVRPRCQAEFTEVRSAQLVQVSSAGCDYV